MTAGDGKTAVLDGFDKVEGGTFGAVVALKNELECLWKERARLEKDHAREIKEMDKKIEEVWHRVLQALNAP